MNTGSLFYFPTLHPEFAPATLPDGILFVPSGLAPLPADAPPALRAFAEKLPFSPREAAQVLADMQATAAERSMETLALESRLPQTPSKPEEWADVNAFAVTGALPTASPDEAGQRLRAERIARQKQLLLAYSLEEQIAAIRQLEERLRHTETALDILLREDPAPAHGLTLDFSLPNKQLLEAVSAFLPQGSALYTDDPAARRAWKELVEFAPAPESLTRNFPALRDMRPLVGFFRPASAPVEEDAARLPLFIPAEEAAS